MSRMREQGLHDKEDSRVSKLKKREEDSKISMSKCEKKTAGSPR